MSIKVPKVTGSENVLKHDDIVSLGREFEGIGESRFLNWAEPYFPPINLYNLPYQLVTPATLQPINKIYIEEFQRSLTPYINLEPVINPLSARYLT